MNDRADFAGDNAGHQPFSPNKDLKDFHMKYQSPVAASPSQPLPPQIVHHVQPSDQQQQPLRSRSHTQRRARELREKRAHLKELQDWEYEVLTTPRRWANPGPIGLLGFGMATLLANLTNTGHFKLDTVVLAVAICVGGGAQLICGVLELIRGNTFGATAFGCFGAYWLTLTSLWMLPNESFKPWSDMKPTSEYIIGTYLVPWGIFNVFMVVCSLRMNVILCVLLLSTTLLFLWQGGAHMTGNESAIRMSGYEGAVSGSLALYISFAELLNETWDRTILPTIPFTDVLDWFGADSSILASADTKTAKPAAETPKKKKTAKKAAQNDEQLA
ncbi:hypothetical protein ABB37_09751 [Leptomonas pyrrhocoris]|uniref:Uncharacterized protein n=1 Tax=Leptomonas pyrrhocoris TaxID=157538 RepID=A0A0M9FQ38_LEPPY|nr:hypothetical protein ABB37_09751 [Leptomonas pyrrhocoris]KPA73619.1 hypothetical protein ABB37_09751 [Leptomonas pyrrhocoris]|eukprot:XP_015652058.1 hypothetical protein ABB37_09751 [Leptomonas pyrrhocoris]